MKTQPLPEDAGNLERHCPRLGHVVRFEYCRSAEEGQGPCFKSLDCWWERFDVVAYFRHRLPAAEFEKLSIGRAPDKVSSLVELIRQARLRTSK